MRDLDALQGGRHRPRRPDGPLGERDRLVNTIVNDDGVLTAHNTDYSAIAQLIERDRLDPAASVLLRGSGGMAKATAAAFRDAGFTRVTIVARNEQNGRMLADLYGFSWRPRSETPPQTSSSTSTPIGMAGGAEEHTLAFSEEAIAAASVVFDVVALPADTPLIAAARSAGTPVITGAEVATLQALEQFVLYTGIRPSAEQVREAEEFMRAGNA